MKALIAGLVLILAMLTYAGYVVYDASNTFRKDCTVTGTDAQLALTDTKIRTSDCGTLRVSQVEDYAKIEVGNRYDMEINNWTSVPAFIRPAPTVKSFKLSPCN